MPFKMGFQRDFSTGFLIPRFQSGVFLMFNYFTAFIILYRVSHLEQFLWRGGIKFFFSKRTILSALPPYQTLPSAGTTPKSPGISKPKLATLIGDTKLYDPCRPPREIFQLSLLLPASTSKGAGRTV